MKSPTFEWDRRKNIENVEKHGVSFNEAQYAFSDPWRVIALDHKHSTKYEKRYFCYGCIKNDIITVRFTWRARREMERCEFSGPDSGEKEGINIMRRIKETETPTPIKEAIESSEIIKDFLPAPDQLVFKEDNVKVTLELSRRSLNRFKRYAKKRGLPYQRMLRSLIDQYAEKALPG